MGVQAEKICVVGLGYVGLPLALAFAHKYPVVGFDVKEQRIQELAAGYDRTCEADPQELKVSSIHFTSDPKVIESCDFIIVAVPTPVTETKIPDLTPLLKASELIGRHLKPGMTIVYESTVYPGATEEDCVPILEQYSGLVCGRDFKIGYSPERINPGDKEHTFKKITKVVSGMDAETLAKVAAVYSSVVEAGVFQAASIKVAEAAKVIENTQRDLNIALMNELAIIFEKMGIRTKDVLAAAGTKWNFLRFMPGLVGGHCIGVDPYYLTHKSLSLGYQPDVILAGRRINDAMGTTVAEKTVRQLTLARRHILEARVLILGFTFKENVPDVRNTKVIDIYTELKSWGCQVDLYDPQADIADARHEYHVEFVVQPPRGHYHALILAVNHQTFIEHGVAALLPYLDRSSGQSVFIDVKSQFNPAEFPADVHYWSL